METYLTAGAALLVITALALAFIGRSRHKIEEVTTESLLKAAQAAVDEAQSLADSRARAIEDDKAALAADIDRIAKARARLAGNAAPSPQP
jgi:hypothetical protein